MIQSGYSGLESVRYYFLDKIDKKIRFTLFFKVSGDI